MINVLDTGAENDGVDELAIYGFDNPDAALQRLLTGHDDARGRPTTSSCCARQVHRQREPVRRHRHGPSDVR